MNPIRILVVGTGSMAANHVRAYKTISGVEVVAGVDLRAEPLAQFCAAHGIPNAFASVEEAIAWGQFDAVSNVTPDRVHYASTMPFLAARKHVLCEKPLATRTADAEAMAEAAAKAGVVNHVNLSYRNEAAVPKAAEMVRSGAIGEVRFFEASYLQSWLTQGAQGDWKTNPRFLWRLSTAHGSKGALGDIGVHILDFTTFVAGLPVAEVSARLATHEKTAGNRIGDYVLDANDSATIQLTLANGALGTVTMTRLASGHHNDLRLRVYGTKGGLELSSEKHISRLRVCLGTDLEAPAWQEIACSESVTNYARFIAAIRGEAVADAPDFSRGAELQRVLDAAEASAASRGLAVSI